MGSKGRCRGLATRQQPSCSDWAGGLMGWRISPRQSSDGIVKKRSRTFVIRSSNPYAAAAAMGLAMARNESSGNYFDPISGPIAGGRPDPLAQSQSGAPPAADPMLKVDFRADWAAFIRRDVAAYGLTFSESRTLEQNTDRYLNAKRRIPRRRARTNTRVEGTAHSTAICEGLFRVDKAHC